MERLVENYARVAKGAPSGIVVSALVHIGVGLIAASIYWVVRVEGPPVPFVPPVIRERPKIELAKLRFNVQENTKPSQAPTRITTPRQIDQKHDFELPATLGAGLGGFGSIEMPSIKITEPGNLLMGDTVGDGFDFVGTFYDFKRDRQGSNRIMDPHQFVAEVARFVRNGWKPSTLARYYRSPKQLHASTFMVPPVKSSIAPAAFDEPDTLGYCWLAHYKGELVHHEDVTFRFWGHGDDILAVRVDGEEVLVACWPGSAWTPQDAITSAAGSWQSSAVESRSYSLGNNTAVVGDWITLKKGEAKKMEVIIGEVPGGVFCSMLTVEVQGAEYELNRQQAPILPIFKTSEPSRDLMDNIYEWLTFDHASLTGGPVFRDVPHVAAVPVQDEHGVGSQEVAEPNPDGRRLWSMADGRQFEANYVCTISGKAVFETAGGRQVKIGMELLSEDGQAYIGLSDPPELDSTFTKQSSQRIIETTPFLNEVPPRIIDYVFGAKIRQVSAHAYGHPLKAELFVLGQQRIDRNKFVLLDRQASSFMLDGENERAHVFKGGPVEIMGYDNDQPLGRKYSDYLLLVTDQRGELVHHSASASWLLPNLENLRKQKVGNFMDKTCRRVFPTGPGPRSLYY